ncbi:MAG: type V CRISPR-associated endonuclease Cas1 [Methylococcales symbiont of Iophon sp. n. MRB-2018]|nr:MAG: type V CRISPR-associated endonuclease Cas1 [Methylococcales symbiont of Iophon sp. n. MRB-2018]
MLSAPDFKQKKIIVALLSYDEKMSFKNDNIVITDKTGIKHQSSCYRLFAVFIVGHATITTGLLQRAKKFGFSIVLLSHGLIPYGSWLAKAEGNVLLRKKQYSYQGMDIAQHIVHNKIDQQIKALKHLRTKTAPLKQAINQLLEYQNRLPNATLDMHEILGIEGIASRVYFTQMFNEMQWKGRKPRAKQDITNLLLDIGYTQLFHFIDALLNLYGFDTYQGVYHQLFYQRKSLVCDLVEPFRIIIDKRVRKAYKLGQIHEEDFSFINGQYRLFGKQSQLYTTFLLKSLLNHKAEIFLYVQSYYRAFMQNKPMEKYPIFVGEG